MSGAFLTNTSAFLVKGLRDKESILRGDTGFASEYIGEHTV